MKTLAKNKLHIIEIVLLMSVVTFLATGVMSLRAQDNLSNNVVRLHVLANSDSPEDQVLKLRVRDVILEQATRLLEKTDDRKEAEALLRGQLLELERIAEEELRNSGYAYSVTAELSNTEFSTREYDGFTLPAGEYLALRIIIGEGEGQNWWCVVFPPLCTVAAADVPVVAAAAGMSDAEVSLIRVEDAEYVLKFKAVEFWETVRQKWEER